MFAPIGVKRYMRNAVIYARYSSHSQTEMSIEGQLAERRIYLYDDHFRILFNNNKRNKTTKREAAEVERYFDSSSETTLYATPKEP